MRVEVPVVASGNAPAKIVFRHDEPGLIPDGWYFQQNGISYPLLLENIDLSKLTITQQNFNRLIRAPEKIIESSDWDVLRPPVQQEGDEYWFSKVSNNFDTLNKAKKMKEITKHFDRMNVTPF